jgi:hypothetical protein
LTECESLDDVGVARKERTMATRTSAQEERIATLQYVMNVISLLDGETPRRSALPEVMDLRALLPRSLEFEPMDDPWGELLELPARSRFND